MKKIYTLIAACAFAFTVTAQDDFAVNLVSHTEGDTDDSDPMDFEFNVENVGTTTYEEGDTLVVSLSIDDAVVGLDLAAGFVNYIFLEAEFAPGDIIAIPPTTGIDWLDQPEPTTISFCAVVFGMGNASFSGPGPNATDYIVNDDDISNNSSCISVELPVAIDDAGIEDLNLVLSNVYIAAGQLMIVNDGANDDVQANLNIVNMNGQIVQTENFVLASGTSVVNLNELSAGIYVVAIETEAGVITRKISIQ